MAKSKLTKETQANICKLIRAGVPYKHAAKAAGISEATFYAWMKMGREKSRGKYPEFLESVKKAEAESVAEAVARIRKSAEKSWQAAAWWLERRHPEDFAKREYTESKVEAKVEENTTKERIKRDATFRDQLRGYLEELGEE